MLKIPLSNNIWSLLRTDAGLVDSPGELEKHNEDWRVVDSASTVATLLPDFTQSSCLDDFDWWYQCCFDDAQVETDGQISLNMDGLATIADVWLNDELILQSNNMFIQHSVDVTSLLKNENNLVICFRSLTANLQIKRPRPKWKTKLVKHQQLRWLRTTLLGRIPGWTPAVPAVGPWKEISLFQHNLFKLCSSHIFLVENNAKNELRTIRGEFLLNVLSDKARPESAILEVGDIQFDLAISQENDGYINFQGESDESELALWWPHTHGQPALHDCTLVLKTNEGEVRFDLGKRGFRKVRRQQQSGLVGLMLNDETVFCRGACWTSNDINSLSGDEKSLRQSLSLAKEAGMNMLRVGGTMVYESDVFYRICDELGIMIWQDFMFANMDYPVDDADFHQSIMTEAKGQLARLSAYACISVYCGSSELQQQAAMLGLAKGQWSNQFFDDELPSLCNEIHPGIPYFPSTPCGGALPFHLSEGLSHYYGVGAYKRPLSDVGLADVKFTPETLGFSHVPEDALIESIFASDKAAMHDPRWKKGVPRDSGAGWDFEDIRDYYLALLFDVDPGQLRSHDPDRYLALSRVVTGELIYRVFAHWRSAASDCRGALIWFYNDLVPGAGWGLIDSTRRPKPVYFAVKRAFVSTGVFIEDRGLNGLFLHLINEQSSNVDVKLELETYGQAGTVLLKASQQLSLEKRHSLSIGTDEMLGYFTDLGYSYKFGPEQHVVVVARLLDENTGNCINEDCYFPVGYDLPRQSNAQVNIEVVATDGGALALRLSSQQFLQSVRLQLRFYETEDNYFHLVPGSTRLIKLLEKHDGEETLTERKPVKGHLEALNLIDIVRIQE